mgnify:CR=1 FL=1
MQSSGDFIVISIGVGIIGLIVLLLPVTRAFRAGYGAVGLFIVIEMVLSAFPLFSNSISGFYLVIGWGFVSIVSTIAIVGADLRTAIRNKATASHPSVDERPITMERPN